MMDKTALRIVCMVAVCSLVLGSPHHRQKRSRMCYGDLGCFNTSHPFNNTDGLLPEFINTTFRLFTDSCRVPRIVSVNTQGIFDHCGFDPSKPVKFIVHGFLQHGQVAWVTDMASAFLTKSTMNVISVDWGSGSGFPYSQASANTRVVGAEIAMVINFLQSRLGIGLDKVHIIGHSLGAHVSGYTGQRVPGLGRITGLDPAEPDFSDTDAAVHLDKSDANFVDVIHSDGSEFNYVSGFGWIEAVGHIDFYPNGGEYQPGCPRESATNFISAAYNHGFEENNPMEYTTYNPKLTTAFPLYNDTQWETQNMFVVRRESLQGGSWLTIANSLNPDQTPRYAASDLDSSYAEGVLSCSHSRSIYLFTESINSDCHFFGHPCESLAALDSNHGNCLRCTGGPCPQMGYSADRTNARGKFYLRTRPNTPFCGHTQHVEVEFGTMARTTGSIQVTLVGRDNIADVAMMESGTHPFIPGDRREILFVDREMLGQIQEVRLTFMWNNYSWWLWSSEQTPVVIYKVTVTSASDGRSIHFCGDHRRLTSRRTITLTRSSTDPSTCQMAPFSMLGQLTHH